MTTQTAEQSLTHHVRLILDNDEGLYNMRREIVRDALADFDAGEPMAARTVADGLQELCKQITGVRDDMGVAQPDLLALEILSTALAFVDWQDMADDYIAEEGE